MLRHLIHLLIPTALVLVGLTLFRAETTRRAEGAVRIEAADALARIQRQVMVRSVLEGGSTARTGTWPASIDPAWFGNDLPENPLLEPGHPWIETASVRERGRMHPVELQAADETDAGFWYNPAKGIVRIRVPVAVSDQASLDLYNELNGTSLTTLWATD